MPSSRSATGWTWSSTPGRRASSSPADRCATTRSSPLPTSAAWRWCSRACATSATDACTGCRDEAGRRRGLCPRRFGASSPAPGATGTAARPRPSSAFTSPTTRATSTGADLGCAAAGPARAHAPDRGARLLDPSPLKAWITREIFNAVYVTRTPAAERDPDEDPLEPLVEALGRRLAGHLSRKARAAARASRSRSSPACTTWRRSSPEVQLIPVWIDNAPRDAQGRGRPGADPVQRDLRRADPGPARRGQARSSNARVLRVVELRAVAA